MTSLARPRSKRPRCRHQPNPNSQITTRTDPLGAKVVAQYSQSIPAPAPMLTLGAAGAVLDPADTSGTTQKLRNIWGAGRVGTLTSQGTTETGQTRYLREKRQFDVTLTDRRATPPAKTIEGARSQILPLAEHPPRAISFTSPQSLA